MYKNLYYEEFNTNYNYKVARVWAKKIVKTYCYINLYNQKNRLTIICIVLPQTAYSIVILSIGLLFYHYP